MVGCHVAHDGRVGNGVVLANHVLLAGHVDGRRPCGRQRGRGLPPLHDDRTPRLRRRALADDARRPAVLDRRGPRHPRARRQRRRHAARGLRARRGRAAARRDPRHLRQRQGAGPGGHGPPRGGAPRPAAARGAPRVHPRRRAGPQRARPPSAGRGRRHRPRRSPAARARRERGRRPVARAASPRGRPPGRGRRGGRLRPPPRAHLRRAHRRPARPCSSGWSTATRPARRSSPTAGRSRWSRRVEDLPGPVDAVTVAVPTSFHLAVAEPLLARGVHCLVEKPIAADVAEAERLVAAARRGGAVLQVGHVERFNPVMAAVDRLKIRPVFLEVHRLAPYTFRSSDVGVVTDLMIHDLDIVLHLVGEEPVARGRGRGARHRAARGHRERPPRVPLGRGRQRHGQPRVDQQDAEDPPLLAATRTSRSTTTSGRRCSCASRRSSPRPSSSGPPGRRAT